MHVCLETCTCAHKQGLRQVDHASITIASINPLLLGLELAWISILVTTCLYPSRGFLASMAESLSTTTGCALLPVAKVAFKLSKSLLTWSMRACRARIMVAGPS